MAKVTVKMPSFSSVAAGSTANVQLPIGLTYEQLHLVYSGLTLAQMNEIRIIGNGKTIQRYSSGTRLDELNQFNGRAAAAGIITIDFLRYGLKTRLGEEVSGLGTGLSPAQTKGVELSTLSVEIDIDGAAAAPALELYAVQSAPKPLGIIKHVREFTYNVGGAGEFEIADIPTGHLFDKVHFHSGNIDRIRLKRDNYVAFDRTDALNQLLQNDGVRVPQTNIFTVDPNDQGYGEESLITAGVRDFRFILDMSGAATIPVTIESLAPFAA